MQDVVAGKKRTRRRGGAGGLLGSDESDEDEDDEEARALRQRLAKKRRVAGDTLDALARDPATASFHATYQMALVDDVDEFAHLDRDQELDSEPEPGRDRGEGEDEGDDGDEGWDGDEGSGRRKRGGESREELEEDMDEDAEMPESSTREGREEEISAAEVRKTLQEVARGERVRIRLQFILSIFFCCNTQINRFTGMSHARPGGCIVDGSRPVRSRHAPRALSVLRHIYIQSAIPCRTSIPRRRRHGRPLRRMYPLHEPSN